MNALQKIVPPKMTVAEFLAWRDCQPTGRYELVHGEVVKLQAERARHAIVKGNVYRALQDCVRARKLPCRVFTDGMTVAINDDVAYEPDAAVQCGVTVDLDALTLDAPMIVVEVSLPSSQNYDAATKMPDYFKLPSIQHVLMIDTKGKRVIRHSRTTGPSLETYIFGMGDAFALNPPGLEISVADCFVDM